MKTIKKILLILNIITALLLLSVYLTVNISPEKISILSLLPFVYVILLGVNVFFVVFWIIFKWKRALISLISILLVIKYITLIFPLSGLLSTNNSEKPDFTIMSYNVMIFGYYDWQNNQKIKSDIMQVIENESPTILCLQEAYWNEENKNFATINLLKQKLDFRYSFRSAMSKAVAGQNFGLVTFSKYPIINSYSYKFKNSFNGYIYNDIIINDDTVRIYNAHLQSINFNQEDYAVIEKISEYDNNPKLKNIIKKYLSSLTQRAKQSEELRTSIDSCKYPVFICGDFNDSPLTYTYNTITNGLNDSFVKKGQYPGYTWEKFKIKQRIDYIIFSITA